MSWKIMMKTSMDKDQTKLNNTGCEPNTHKFAEKDYHVSYNEKVLCPYCMLYDVFEKFKKTKGLYKCPECSNIMYMRTLATIRKMTFEEFARWVFDNRKFFWAKLKNFDKWNKRMFDMDSNFGLGFWEKYKQIKGEEYDGDEY